MSRYTHEENRSSLQGITVQAYEAGLLKTNQRLSYEKGNGNYALPTRIRVEEFNQTTGKWEYISSPVWVPEFSWKDGPTVVGNTLTAVSNVLWGIIQPKREAEDAERKRKMNFLAEHTARRSE